MCMKTFFRTLVRTMHDKSFYREIKGTSFSQALAYFLKYHLLITVVITVWAMGMVGWFLFGGALDEIVGMTEELYPEDLAVTVEDGVVSTNVQEPYFVPIPQEWEADSKGQEVPFENILVIDTNTPVSLEAAETYSTAVLVGERSFGVHNENRGFEIQRIPENVEVVIDRAWVEEKAAWISRMAKPIVFAVALLAIPTVVFLSLSIVTLLYLLFAALLFWLVMKTKRLDYTYSQSYISSMYLVTLPQLVMLLLGWIPFGRTIVFVVMAALLVEENKPQPEGASTESGAGGSDDGALVEQTTHRDPSASTQNDPAGIQPEHQERK